MDQRRSSNQEPIQADQTESRNFYDSDVVSFNAGGQSNDENGSEEIILEQLEQNPYDVSYTCLLLPRLASHFLLGEVADRLQILLKQISISFGWHLEFFSIKQEYFQWTVRLPPSISTTYVIQVVRMQTSQEIFSDFPRFKRENQSEDFWAPGYLVFWGSQPHPVEVIQRYIQQTRRQQGIRVNE